MVWRDSWLDLAVRFGAVGTPFEAALRLPMSLALAHFNSHAWEQLERAREARDKLAANQIQATNNVVLAIGHLGRALSR